MPNLFYFFTFTKLCRFTTTCPPIASRIVMSTDNILSNDYKQLPSGSCKEVPRLLLYHKSTSEPRDYSKFKSKMLEERGSARKKVAYYAAVPFHSPRWWRRKHHKRRGTRKKAAH